jgi:hypothetical protein
MDSSTTDLISSGLFFALSCLLNVRSCLTTSLARNPAMHLDFEPRYLCHQLKKFYRRPNQLAVAIQKTVGGPVEGMGDAVKS